MSESAYDYVGEVGEFIEPTDEDSGTPDDTPEEITAEEAAHTDIPLSTETPSEDVGHLTALVCDVCLELNLTHPTSVVDCARCGKAFCLHFASSIDVMYCVNCMSEVSVEKSVITKTYEHKNEETGEVSYYRRRARQIKIGGLDWLFASRKVNDLSEIELDLTIEYHRNILGLMIAEQEKKRAEKAHRYAGVKVVYPTYAANVVNTTTVKKTRTVSKTKAQEQLAALLKSLVNQGLSVEDLARMVTK